MLEKKEGFASPQESIKSSIEVRELAPEKFWAGSISVENLSDEEFAETIKEMATELDFTYSGYRTKKEGGGFKYNFSRYPRKAFGPVAPIEKHQEALEKLAGKIGGESKEEQKTEEPKFRVLLGLQEGYEEHKKKSIVDEINNGKIATIEDAKKAIQEQIRNISGFGIELDNIKSLEQLKDTLEKANFGKDHTLEEVRIELGDDFDLMETEIYSAGSWGNYTEPAVVIEGDKSQLQEVYAIAEKYHQARIVVEDLQEGTSRMVETKYCEDPDKE